MEANSITPVKADYRTTGAQAQNELGDIFQDLLRESAGQFETPAAPSRYDNRPDQAESPRESVSERARATTRAKSDPRDKIDDNSNDYSVVEAPASADPRPASGPADNSDKTASTDNADEPVPPQSADSNQPDQDDGFSAATASTGTEQQDQNSKPAASTGIVANPLATSVGAAPSPADVPLSSAGIGGGTPPAAQVNAGLASDSGQTPAGTNGTSQTPAKANSPAQGTATAPAVAATGSGNGLAAQVSVEPVSVVSQPAANLGGGAATAALATATPQNRTGPSAPSADAGSHAAQGALNPGTAAAATQGQPAPGAANPQAASPNAQVLSSEGEALAAQTAAAATAAQKQNSTAATTPAPGTDSPAGAQADADQPNAPIQAGQTAAARNGSATGNPPPNSGDAAATLIGQNTAGSGNSAKTASTPSQDSRAAAQPQFDMTPKSQVQAAPPANPAAAVASMGQSQTALQAGTMGGVDGAAGSSGSVDTVSNAGSSPTQVATGGFAQPAMNSSGVIASQTQPGAAHSTPADQVAVEIQKAVGAGKDHVRVRLHPAELGQIDISLKVRHDGTIRAIVTTDRSDTFDLLQRDSRGLERALQDAGLKTDSGSLNFNLRGGENNGPNGGQSDTGGTAQANMNSDRTANPPPADLDVPISVVSSHALDIRV